jgi:replicative DNA helicase
MDIPVVALSQVRRETEGRAPCLNDLRESGSLEQDADIVMFLHRERDSEDTELILAKQRNGPTGKVSLRFVAQYGKFIGR